MRPRAALAGTVLVAALVAGCSINPIPTPAGDTRGGGGGTYDAAAPPVGFDAVAGEDAAARPDVPAPADAAAEAAGPADTARPDAAPPDADAGPACDLTACPPLADPVCQRHACTADGACVVEDADGPCEDGWFCTVDDRCSGGACVGGAARDCGEPGTSTESWCDEDGDTCRPPPDRSCGSGCTAGADCDDGDPCTVDTCLTFVTPTQCICEPIDFCACDPSAADGGAADCDDGRDDTCGDACVPTEAPAGPHRGLCQREPCCPEPCAADADCDDGEAMTVDACVPFGPEDELRCCIHPWTR